MSNLRSNEAPQKTRDVQKDIKDFLQQHSVVLFMKGNAHMPMCGFSAAVVAILQEIAVPFETINVLEDPDVREGIKTYGQWATIPQLYIQGEFIGGCDIVRQMHQQGQLEPLLRQATAKS